VDALQAIENTAHRKRKRTTIQKAPSPIAATTTPTARYVFDHVFIARQTSRAAARKATQVCTSSILLAFSFAYNSFQTKAFVSSVLLESYFRLTPLFNFIYFILLTPSPHNNNDDDRK
jgi:chorismate synthase